MSVDKLNLKEGSTILTVTPVTEGCLTLDIYDSVAFKQIGLDRSQARLLMLWLQEHLK